MVDVPLPSKDNGKMSAEKVKTKADYVSGEWLNWRNELWKEN
jgi:hypothetical protein